MWLPGLRRRGVNDRRALAGPHTRRMTAVLPANQAGREMLRRMSPRLGSFAARKTGLLTVAAGAALMTWAMAAHYQAALRGWAVNSRLTPPYLLRRGAYRLSRNPMHAGEAVVWFGWALHYRRRPVWAGLAIHCAAFAAIARWEERRLLNRFGDDYRAYLDQVPRWVPRCPGRFQEIRRGAQLPASEMERLLAFFRRRSIPAEPRPRRCNRGGGPFGDCHETAC